MDYLLNGLPYFPGTTVFDTGLFADGTAAAPSVSFLSDTNTGIYRRAADVLGIAIGGVGQGYIENAGGSVLRIGNGVTVATRLDLFDSGAIALVAAGTAQNIVLAPSTTGVVSIANGSVAMGATSSAIAMPSNVSTFYVGDSATNFNQFRIGPSNTASVLWLTNNRALVGTAVDSGALFQLGTNTTTSAGGMVFGTDTFVYRLASNVLSISGGLFCGTYIAAGVTSSIGWNGRASMTSPADGVIALLNNANTDFTRLQFGGTTASFPGIQRNATGLDLVLADGSDYCAVRLKTVSAGGTAVWSAGVGSPEGVVTAPIGSLYSRTNGGAATSFYVKESGSGNTGWVAK